MEELDVTLTAPEMSPHRFLLLAVLFLGLSLLFFVNRRRRQRSGVGFIPGFGGPVPPMFRRNNGPQQYPPTNPYYGPGQQQGPPDGQWNTGNGGHPPNGYQGNGAGDQQYAQYPQYPPNAHTPTAHATDPTNVRSEIAFK